MTLLPKENNLARTALCEQEYILELVRDGIGRLVPLVPLLHAVIKGDDLSFAYNCLEPKAKDQVPEAMAGQIATYTAFMESVNYDLSEFESHANWLLTIHMYYSMADELDLKLPAKQHNGSQTADTPAK